MVHLNVHCLICTISVVGGQAYRSFGRFLAVCLFFQEFDPKDKESIGDGEDVLGLLPSLMVFALAMACQVVLPFEPFCTFDAVPFP